MASAAERSFVTTVCFCQEIGRCINNQAMSLEGREWLKRKSLEMTTAANEYRKKFNRGMGRKDVARVQKGLDGMLGAGLESCHSYQSYLAFLIPILNERKIELQGAKKFDTRKVLALDDMIQRAEELNRYYEQRIRYSKFKLEGCDLLDSFNSVQV